MRLSSLKFLLIPASMPVSTTLAYNREADPTSTSSQSTSSSSSASTSSSSSPSSSSSSSSSSELSEMSGSVSTGPGGSTVIRVRLTGGPGPSGGSGSSGSGGSVSASGVKGSGPGSGADDLDAMLAQLMEAASGPVVTRNSPDDVINEILKMMDASVVQAVVPAVVAEKRVHPCDPILAKYCPNAPRDHTHDALRCLALHRDVLSKECEATINRSLPYLCHSELDSCKGDAFEESPMQCLVKKLQNDPSTMSDECIDGLDLTEKLIHAVNDQTSKLHSKLRLTKIFGYTGINYLSTMAIHDSIPPAPTMTVQAGGREIVIPKTGMTHGDFNQSKHTLRFYCGVISAILFSVFMVSYMSGKSVIFAHYAERAGLTLARFGRRVRYHNNGSTIVTSSNSNGSHHGSNVQSPVHSTHSHGTMNNSMSGINHNNNMDNASDIMNMTSPVEGGPGGAAPINQPNQQIRKSVTFGGTNTNNNSLLNTSSIVNESTLKITGPNNPSADGFGHGGGASIGATSRQDVNASGAGNDDDPFDIAIKNTNSNDPFGVNAVLNGGDDIFGPTSNNGSVVGSNSNVGSKFNLNSNNLPDPFKSDIDRRNSFNDVI